MRMILVFFVIVLMGSSLCFGRQTDFVPYPGNPDIIKEVVGGVFDTNYKPSYTDQDLANAIFKAEGSYKATYLYGIKSVGYKDEADARRICLNTIRNNHKRYADYGNKEYDTYLEFLASRYCPVSAHKLNQYWLKNVRYFLNEEV